MERKGSIGDARASHEQAVLARRKEIEDTRRFRMHDKSYKVGVDYAALASQIADKEAARLEEAASDAAFDELRLNVDKHLMYVDQQRDAYLRDRDHAVNEFRRTHQKKEDRREADLNDPNAVRNGQPLSEVSSVSSIQRFAGEDEHAGERMRMQQAQLREWAAAQVEEKRKKAEAERQTDAMWANHMLEADLLRCQFADKEQEIYRQRLAELAEHNLAQDAFKKALQREADVQAEIDNATEIQAQLNSSWLGEDAGLTRSFLQPHRARPDHFKGLTAEQKQAIIDELAKQRDAKKAAEAEERELEKRIDDMTMHWNRVAMLQEHEVEQRRAELRKKIAAENGEAAKTSKLHYSTLYNDVYINKIDDDFFKRFGTSAR